ncbi:VWA domain-containing protein [Oscillatoria sp. CS-180]|uniref:VWA domain-containing protein n=1 Tax=Oscillatoria sp. CS-180 TaxID=3021720 RepID=UPI0023310259|nr:VWA domain-containing protein [Oscillatoria sp. CS-180]MDB9526098.1 VWA domain-containing protein [Oscillatoria sp. CS-180]
MSDRLFNLSVAALAVLGLSACNSSGTSSEADSPNFPGFEVNVLVGSALHDFCDQTAERFNNQSPSLESGEQFYIVCDAAGSGDVVNQVLNQTQLLQSGAISENDAGLPSLISVDGEIYHSQLIYQMQQIAPGQNYIPQITDAPLVAYSPMVFMTREDLASSLESVDDLFIALTEAETHQDLNAASPPQNIYYVHTAPTRSNSGLQTLVAQFASVTGKRPGELTAQDVADHQADIQKIQEKITRYGTSTSSLAEAMVQNGPFWASIGSVYESSVIAANTQLQPGQPKYVAVYPQATFTSNMRGILLDIPWVNDQERAAATEFLDYLQEPEAQAIATELGLRPGSPGVALSSKFSPEFGVDPNASYDSYRPPEAAVVETMIKAWTEFAKKPSLVVIVVDSSGSMSGNKLPSVQNTLQTYIDTLGPQDQIALVDFDDQIRPPVMVDGSPEGLQRGYEFINSLRPRGGTRLYDASLDARDWLRNNLREGAINAVLVLTDGEDSGSNVQLNNLLTGLKESDFSTDERIAFFTIGYGNEGDFNPDILNQIAESTGGYYAKGDPDTIARLMQDIQLEF